MDRATPFPLGRASDGKQLIRKILTAHPDWVVKGFIPTRILLRVKDSSLYSTRTVLFLV